jgi:hypothetical protein
LKKVMPFLDREPSRRSPFDYDRSRDLRSRQAFASLISVLCSLFFGFLPASAQQPAPLNTTGEIMFAGRSTPYLIRHLPVNAFPDLPEAVQLVLNRRGCLIPQSYEARKPENVVQASLKGPGSSDWAVLCSVDGKSSLLVFLSSAPSEPVTLASALETERLQQRDSTGALGFNWVIDSASPAQVRQAQAGMNPRPPLLDHDALADAAVDRRTVYRYYAHGAWTLVSIPEP